MRYKNVEFRRARIQTWQDESGNGITHPVSDHQKSLLGKLHLMEKSPAILFAGLKKIRKVGISKLLEIDLPNTRTPKH